MAMWLRQSTASQVIRLGPFLDSVNGDSEMTSLVIANTAIRIWKAGTTTEVSKNSGGATHISNGRYYATLDATDTNTLGQLEINVHVAGALSVRREYMVLPPVVYDALVLGTDNLDVNSIQLAGQTVTAGAGVTFPSSVASPTNITAGTITTTTNLTNLPSIPSNWITAAGITAGALNGKGDWNVGKTGYSLTQSFPANFSSMSISVGGLVDMGASAVAGAVWDAATASYGTANTYGALIETNLDAPVSAAGGGSLTAADIADAVWDEVLSGHLTAGTTGAGLNAAGSAGDPWSTTLPGAYGAGTAGKIIGDNLNATVSSRAAQTDVTAIKTKTDFLPSVTAGASGGVFIAGSNAVTTVDFTGTITTVTNLTNLPSIPAGWLTAAGIAASALNGKGDWNIGKTGYSLTQAFPTNFSSMSISAGGLVDITQTAADKAWGTAARTLTAGTNIVLAKGTGITGFNDLDAAAAATAIWNAATATYGSAGSYGLLIETNLDAQVSTAGGGSLTAAAIADAVWDEATSGHAIAGSTGAKLSSAASAGDPWSTALPGAYVAGSAGKILSDSLVHVDTLLSYVDTEIASSIAEIKDKVDTNLDVVVSTIGGGSLTAAIIADAVWDEAISGHATTGSTGSKLSAASAAGDPWSVALPGAYSAGTAGYIIGNRIDVVLSTRLASSSYTAAPTAAVVAGAVWDETMASHLTAGSTGDKLNTGGSGTDPWATTLPGAYGAGTAGKLLSDNLNATVSSRATQTSVDAIAGYVDTEVAAIKAKTDFLPSATAGAAGGLFIAGTNAATTVSITGNITGNLSGSVGSVTAGVTLAAVTHTGAIIPTVTTLTNLPSIPAGWLTASGIAAGALTGKGDWNVGKSGYTLLQGFPTNFSAMSISAGGLVDILQTAADKAWGTASRTLSAGTNIVLAKGTGITGFNDLDSTATATAVWNAATGTYGTVGSYGLLVETNLDAAVSSVSGGTGTADWTANQITAISAILGVPASGTAPADPTTGILDTIRDAAVAIKAKTDLLPTDPADASDVAAVVAVTNGKVDAVQADVDNLQTRIPAALVGGRIDANLGAISSDTTTLSIFKRAIDGTCIGTVGGGSTTTSIVSSALTPSGSVLTQFKGRIITFDRNTTTAALRGQSTDITASTAAANPTFTVTALTTAAVAGDTFSIS